eukprot:scaffold90043_cov25-Tisochrysis_lutea.AAC.5
MNAAPDGYMIEQLLDHAGWVPIATLLALPRMQRLCHPQARRRRRMAHPPWHVRPPPPRGEPRSIAQDEAPGIPSRQVAAVAHVLQHSPKLEVSTDRAYVRATVQPLRSPAKPAPPRPEARAAALDAVSLLMGDANLVFDRHLQARAVSAVPHRPPMGQELCSVRLAALRCVVSLTRCPTRRI